MKRRSFLAGLLAAPLLPHLPAEAQNPCMDIVLPGPLTVDFETFEAYCAADVNAAFSWAFNTGRVVRYAFPDRPVIPTKIARFCDGRD